MRKILPIVLALILVSLPAQAASLSDDLAMMQTEWARIKYQLKEKQDKLAAIAKLEQKAAATTQAYPKSAEAKVWEAIILATDANITKSISGLPKVEKAKSLLEESLKINPKAMNGAAHMTLGSLYFQVPGWPVGFGSDKLAEQHFQKALAIDSANMDTNYWYGEFMLDQGRYSEAVTYLQRAQQAPVRKDRRMADEGRLNEIQFSLSKAIKKSHEKVKGNE